MSATYPTLRKTTFPDAIQEFIEMRDIVATDGPLIKQMQEAWQAGNQELANTYLHQIPNYESKYITAEKLNILFQTCQALQQFYSDDISEYVDSKQADWQSIIGQFNYQGVYSPTTQYHKNNWVSYTYMGLNQLYICIKEPSNYGIAPSNTTYWRLFTVQGDRGPSGEGMSFAGTWSASTNYSVQDLVSYDNGVWGCLVANLGQEPYEGSTYWNLVYRVAAPIIPTQSNPPATAELGSLWFEVL